MIRLNTDGSLDTTFNADALSTLGGEVSYTEGDAAVSLDASVAVFDIDLAALNSGLGDYSGATITLSRQGGADPQDLFSGIGSLELNTATGEALLALWKKKGLPLQ